MNQGHDSTRGSRPAGLPLEIVAIWVLVAAESIAIFITYWRLPAEDLYHVSGSGFAGGASRVLVYLNWPVALLAIPILLLLAEHLDGRGPKVAALGGIVLAGAVFVPGVVKESDLDAKWVNAIAALGVLVAASLTAFAWTSLGRLERLAAQPGDWLRIVVPAAALVLGVPWIVADIGVSFDGVPVLGTLYQTGELRTQPGMPEPHPAVHPGYHHGMAGVLLVLGAVLLSRLVPFLARAWLHGVLTAYLVLMFCYGAGNIANDFWLEQVVKRGWTDWEIPNVTTPKASVAWGLLLLAAAVIWTISFWRDRRAPDRPLSGRPETA